MKSKIGISKLTNDLSEKYRTAPATTRTINVTNRISRGSGSDRFPHTLRAIDFPGFIKKKFLRIPVKARHGILQSNSFFFVGFLPPAKLGKAFSVLLAFALLALPFSTSGGEEVANDSKKGLELAKGKNSNQRGYDSAYKTDEKLVRKRIQKPAKNNINHGDTSKFNSGFAFGVVITILLVMIIYGILKRNQPKHL